MLGRLSALFTPPSPRVTSSMRWDTFLELMRTEGFRIEDEPSTSGSVVRFYPPNSDDESIIFHKPHPDPTITPQMLAEFSKKLKRKYEWIDTDFILLSKEMPWHTFVKLMREKGFQYHPADFGSSARFDPPNPKDVSITFHKPHPDPTIHPLLLKDMAKKLRKNYDWIDTSFLQT